MSSNNTNPWVVQQAGGQPPLPRGNYFADFAGAEIVQIPERQGSDVKVNRIRFTWKVTTGTEAGKMASTLTEPDIRPTTKAGRLISGMIGRNVVPGEDVQALVMSQKGKTFLVGVGPGPKGGKDSVQTVGPKPQMN
jgi:hypothetical protein